MTSFASCLYTGTVMHRRVRPRAHRLQYNVFSALIDLDEIADLDSDVLGFGYNRFSALSFYDRDHGPRDGSPLRPWVEAALEKAGIDIEGGPIRLLCYLRMFGYVFNPLCVYFCYYPDGRLAAVLHQVSNTFGQSHTYLVPTPDADGSMLRHSVEKGFYVSPFIEMDMTYRFRIRPPGEEIAVAIHESNDEGALLFASFSGSREPLTRMSVLQALTRYPLMTLKVIGGIHWEALLLWRKGVPLVHRPAPPTTAVTVIDPHQQTEHASHEYRPNFEHASALAH